MTRSQHLGVVIGLFGLWHVLRYLSTVVDYVDSLFSGGWITLAVFVIEPILLAAVVVGRQRLAEFLLRSEASRPVRQIRGLVIGGLILMGFDLVERGFWYAWDNLAYGTLETAAGQIAPSVLCGAGLVLGARPIATLLTGQR